MSIIDEISKAQHTLRKLKELRDRGSGVIKTIGNIGRRDEVANDAYPRRLTTWAMYRDGDTNTRVQNLATEFAGRDAPKLKFLFTVEFDIDESIRDYLDLGSREMGEIKYACKMATRPNVQVNYADVNMYNYRFKVATKVDYGSVTLSLYDDNKNLAHNLFLYYLNAISPVSNKPPEQYDLRGDPIQEWASLGPLPESAKFGLIKRMTVTHHYSNTYADDGESSHKSINYHYMNPKIQQFNLDELDMGVGSEASMITLTFVYDSVYTEYDDYKPNVEVLPLEVANSTNDPLTYVWDGGDPDRPIA